MTTQVHFRQLHQAALQYVERVTAVALLEHGVVAVVPAVGHHGGCQFKGALRGVPEQGNGPQEVVKLRGSGWHQPQSYQNRAVLMQCTQVY